MLPLDAWDSPEERRHRVGKALEGWDIPLLEEGLRAYLGRTRRRVDSLAVAYARKFLEWLRDRGSSPYPRWPGGVVKEFLEELKLKGSPGGDGRPLTWYTVRRYWVGIRYLFQFLEWAGHPPPAHLEFPPFGWVYRQGAPHLSEREWEALWQAADRFMPAHWRPFLRTLLVLLGEAGLALKEACTVWRDDVVLRGEASFLRVRGPLEREVPLSPLARKVLAEWLPLRDMLAGQQPLPYPHLLLNPAPRRYRGRPVPPEYATRLLQQTVQLAGFPESERHYMAHRLRWRAIRRFLAEGRSPREVAYLTGMRTLGLRSPP